MRRFAILLACLGVFGGPAMAGEVYLPIAGSVGVFRTDVRMFNPSFNSDIEVKATFLPAGNVSNLNRQPVILTLPRREMRVFDDAVSGIFNASGLGAIRFETDGEVLVTSRIYAQTSAGTLGQFITGADPATAGISRGVVLHLKSNDEFRTNLGLVNLAGQPTTVRVQIFDRSNAPVGQASAIVLEPFGVIAPTNVASGFFGAVGEADLSDAWVRVSAEDDRKVLAYGSVIDNATTDPVFIPVLRDNGVEPPASITRVFDVVASQFRFDIQPGGALRANVGDTVVLRLRSSDVVHGFSMLPLVGDIRVDSSVTEVSFVVNAPGTFTYICTVATCGEGHSDMVGVMTVDP